MRSLLLSACFAGIALASPATPVAVEWKEPQRLPASVARPFCGFVEDGLFIVAGGTTHDGTTKRYVRDVYLLSGKAEGRTSENAAKDAAIDPDGIQKARIGELPDGVGFAEGVSASVPSGL